MGAGGSVAASEAAPAFIDSPALSWLGEGRKALIATHKYSDKDNPAIPKGGRGQVLQVGLASAEAPKFTWEGDTIVRADDLELALELNHRKLEVDSELSFWNCQGNRSWFCKWSPNANGTISPHGRPDLVLGIMDKQSKVVLVQKDDEARRLVFVMGEAMKAEFAKEAAMLAAAKAAEDALKGSAVARCTPAFVEEFMRNGFTKLTSFVPENLVKEALAEINREVGRSSVSPDAFKAKTFAQHHAITDLISKSGLPALLKRMMGGEETRYHPHAGQLALRFPGDQCDGDKWSISPEFFNGVRRGWHIDGCPNNFIPGKTDHWGEVRNFDCLIGVLLSDVNDKMGGELCCYPGSHYILADYFKRKGFDEVYNQGKLPTGAETDALFKTPPTHCVGKAGDVFIANYMTAHLIAPNVSSGIRYACYFRVHGPAFGDGKASHPDSMLDPWLDWPGINGRGGDAAPPPATAAPAPEAVEHAKRVREGYSTMNYDHLQVNGLCKEGCGRPVAPGVSKAGRAFTTCCRDCPRGSGHSKACDELFQMVDTNHDGVISAQEMKDFMVVDKNHDGVISTQEMKDFMARK